ncbi:hypothetical protein [Brevundimonas sp.]|uniref:hypothetical protein n=1 Tax=Brevundimonas sp. TaxID=1871086 RepID=UPI00262D91B9|nr:hypothetical protein [Brevundimonas sp.]
MPLRLALPVPPVHRPGRASLLLAVVALGLGACAQISEDEQFCRDVAQRLVRSPSTFKVTEAIVDYDGFVAFEAEAANAYGTPVESSFSCQMRKTDDPNARPSIQSLQIDGAEVDPYALFSAETAENTSRLR